MSKFGKGVPATEALAPLVCIWDGILSDCETELASAVLPPTLLLSPAVATVEKVSVSEKTDACASVAPAAQARSIATQDGATQFLHGQRQVHTLASHRNRQP